MPAALDERKMVGIMNFLREGEALNLFGQEMGVVGNLNQGRDLRLRHFCRV